MIHVELSTALTQMADGRSSFELNARNLGEVMNLVAEEFPGLHAAITAGETLKPFVKVFADGVAVRLPADKELVLRADCRLRIVVAVAGG